MLLFVYGELMKNGSEFSLIKNQAKFITKGYVQGKLYDLRVGFPAVVETDNNNSEVFGELYEVPFTTIQDVDRFQGFNPKSIKDSLFIRKEVKIKSFSKKEYIANVYFLPREKLADFAVIEKITGGRWG